MQTIRQRPAEPASRAAIDEPWTETERRQHADRAVGLVLAILACALIVVLVAERYAPEGQAVVVEARR